MRTNDAQGALADVLGFTSADLEANAAGRISEGQARALRARQTQLGCYGLTIVAVALGVSFGALFVREAVASRVTSDNALLVGIVDLALLVVAIGVVGVSLTMAVALIRSILVVRRDVREGNAAKVTGRAKRPTGGRDVRLTIGSETFVVERAIYDAFREGQAYTVYYAPNTKALLSARQIGVEGEPTN